MTGIDPRTDALLAAHADPSASLSYRLDVALRRIAALERGAVSSRRFAFDATEVATASTSPVDLGGPAFTFVLDSERFLEAMLDVESMNDTAGMSAITRLSVTGYASQQVLEETSAAGVWQRLRNGLSAQGSTGAGPVLTVPVGPGTVTVAMLYHSGSGGTSHFRNRRLWVALR